MYGGKKMYKKIFIIVTVLCFSVLLNAQGLAERLESLSKENARGYMSPFADAVGAGLNSGLYNSAKTLKPIIGFNVKVNTVMLSIPSSDKTYIAKSPDPNIWADNVETSTIFGKRERKKLTYLGGNTNLDIPLYGGLDMNNFYLPSVSLSYGLPMGIELMARYMPEIEPGKAIGKISFWGAGVKYDIDQHIPVPIPFLNIAAQSVYQQMTIGSVADMSTIAFNLLASANFPFIGFYGGIGYESSTLDVGYTFKSKDENAEPTRVNLKIDSENDMKMTVGVKLSPLPLIDVFADYSVAKFNSLNVGVGVGL